MPLAPGERPPSWVSELADSILRRRGRLLLTVVFICGVAHVAGVSLLGDQSRLLRGDARRYFVYLPSLVLDHNLDFHNDMRRLSGVPPDTPAGERPARAPTGASTNIAPIGAAIFWSPFFLLALVLQAGGRILTGTEPLWDGYGLLPQISASLAGVLYAGAAAGVTTTVLDRWFSRTVSTGATVAAWLATPAVYYTVIAPNYAHAVAWFAVAVAIWLWLQAREREEVGSTLAWGATGLGFGLAAVVRPQDLLFLGAPLLDLAWPRHKSHWSFSHRVRAVLSLLGGCLLGFAVSPQGSWTVIGR